MSTECRIGRDCDFDKVLPQRFSLPSCTIYYMTKNPTSPAVYEKLIRSCKYWYSKNPIFVIDEIKFTQKGCYLLKNGQEKCFWSLCVSQIFCKLWILKFFEISNEVVEHVGFLKRLLREKVYQTKGLYFHGIGIALDKIVPPEIIQSVKNVCFYRIGSIQADETAMTLEKNFKFFPNLDDFTL